MGRRHPIAGHYSYVVLDIVGQPGRLRPTVKSAFPATPGGLSTRRSLPGCLHPGSRRKSAHPGHQLVRNNAMRFIVARGAHPRLEHFPALRIASEMVSLRSQCEDVGKRYSLEANRGAELL